MKCYNCGCQLSEKDFCTGCGVEVSLYKKLISYSSLYYNDGLEKANVRDLSGAISSLKQSLKFNKNHIEARNLLGLVYFEMGEVVAALSEWVISKNIQPLKNLADDYISAIQSNPTRLETINQTIKKYNQALVYCSQDSNDLAIIQLKKVLSLNPNYVRAHQLLALLYMTSEDWPRAKRELQRCTNIDINNKTTLRYLKEVNAVIVPEDDKGSAKKKRTASGEVKKFQSGNEIIIQPMNIKETKGSSTVFNIIIGAAIGIAIAWFLILPAAIMKEKTEINDQLRIVGEQLDAKSVSIEELEQTNQSLQENNKKLEDELNNYVGTDSAMRGNDALLKAATAYINNPADAKAVGEFLEIDQEFLDSAASESFMSLYNKLLELIGPTASISYYETGFQAYKQGDYPTAIKDLEKAVQFDENYGDALYNLGNAYNQNGDADKAREIYEKVIDQYPNTKKAEKSADFLAALND